VKKISGARCPEVEKARDQQETGKNKNQVPLIRHAGSAGGFGGKLHRVAGCRNGDDHSLIGKRGKGGFILAGFG
jgi:hypothetical protein